MQRAKIPFASPISIRAVGDGNTVRTVKSVNGACAGADRLPHARRGPVYQETMAVLQAALDGSASAENAREAFEAFAIHAGVLARDWPGKMAGRCRAPRERSRMIVRYARCSPFSPSRDRIPIRCRTAPPPGPIPCRLCGRPGYGHPNSSAGAQFLQGRRVYLTDGHLCLPRFGTRPLTRRAFCPVIGAGGVRVMKVRCENLAVNLRRLCAAHGSIAAVCREMGVNCSSTAI